MSISENLALENVDGLIGLTTVSGFQIFFDDEEETGNLLQLYGLSSLKDFGEGGDLYVESGQMLNYFGLQPLANQEFPDTQDFGVYYTVDDDYVVGVTKAQIAALDPPNPRDFFEGALNRFVKEGASPSVIKSLSFYAGCPQAIKAAVSCGGINQAQANVLLQGLQVEAFQDQLSLLPPKGMPLYLSEPARSARPSGAIRFQTVLCPREKSE